MMFNELSWGPEYVYQTNLRYTYNEAVLMGINGDLKEIVMESGHLF